MHYFSKGAKKEYWRTKRNLQRTKKYSSEKLERYMLEFAEKGKYETAAKVKKVLIARGYLKEEHSTNSR